MKLFCVILFLIAGQLSAQNYVDLLKLHMAQTPENSFDSIDGTTAIQEFGADLTLPIVLANENAIVTGLVYENINLKLHPEASSTTLTTLNLKVGYNVIHSDKLTASYILLPKISSDMESIGSKDFQIGGVALFKLKKTDNFKYHFGLYANQDLFGPFLVPLLGFYYKSENDKLEINATLPVWADINYSLNNWFRMGANFSAVVRSYHLSESNAYVVKKSNDLFGYLQFHLTKSILLQTKVGYTIGRSYNAYQDADKTSLGVSAFRFGDDRTQLNPTFEDGIVYRARLIYRFHL